MRPQLPVPRSHRAHRRRTAPVASGLPAATAAADPAVLADLRHAKLPANPTRVRILTRMRALDRPVTPDALCQQLNGDLSRVSVYRTLAEMARADLVSSFRLPGGKIVYSAGRAQPALRLTCPRCGRSATAPEVALEKTAIAAMAALGYSDQEVLILTPCLGCTDP